MAQRGGRAQRPSGLRRLQHEAEAPRQVVEALIALGWSERVATEVVDDVTAASDAATVPALLKLALAQLGPARSPKATKEQSSV